VRQKFVAETFARARALDEPAMSTNSTAAGMMTDVLAIWESGSSRVSGTVTMPTFGSMVQNG